MAYDNLRFFDSDSNQLNFEFNNSLGYYQGNIYLPVVSTGLYETSTIYILEEAQGDLGQPLFITPVSESQGITKMKFEFQGGYGTSEDIYLYSSELLAGIPHVAIDKFQERTLLDNSYQTGTTQDGLKIVNNQAKAIPLDCKIALNSEIEGFHVRTLNISINNSKIAEVRVYGEVEGEDERLSVLLENMGMNLEAIDYYIFKDSDIKEAATDYILLNQKRKELLLQASEIKPFIGTYKALLHAIDFFGYNNVTLKEYWLNINEQSENFGKLTAIAVPNQLETGFLANKNRKLELPNSNQKKTSRFSLVYRINNPDGGVDQWDIPTVEEAFDFSPDEVLIKLYGLKRKLQKNFLPLQAKIVDITGEGDYFSQFNQNVWNNQHAIKNQDAGREFESVKVPADRTIYIEDLRQVDYRLTGFGQDFEALTKQTRSELADSIEAFYTTYYDKDLSTFNTLAGIPIGAPVVLKVDGLDDNWDAAQFTWMDAEDTGNHMLTWENWWHRGVYEIEWVIRGKDYTDSFRGPVDDYNRFPVVIPRTGLYTVEANLYDLYNVKSALIKKEWLDIKSKNIEIYGLTQIAPKELSWADYKFAWGKSGSDWQWSRENLLPVGDVIGTYYLTMDRANYVNDDQDGTEFSTVRRFLDTTKPSGFNETAGPYQWGQLNNHRWEDGPELSWYMTRVGSDVNSSFKMDLLVSNSHQNGFELIISQQQGNAIITDEYTITSAYPVDSFDLAAWDAIADELNNLDPVQYPILSKFNYNPLFVDSDNDPNTGTGPQGTDECFHILAVAEEPSRNYDYIQVGFANPLGGTISNEIHFTSYNPSFEDTYIIRELENLHKLNHLTLSYDNTNMPGVISHKWRLINNTLEKEDIYYDNKWMTYLFKDKGYYTVELELTDLNGNKNITKKNIVNII